MTLRVSSEAQERVFSFGCCSLGKIVAGDPRQNKSFFAWVRPASYDIPGIARRTYQVSAREGFKVYRRLLPCAALTLTRSDRFELRRGVEREGGNGVYACLDVKERRGPRTEMRFPLESI